MSQETDTIWVFPNPVAHKVPCRCCRGQVQLIRFEEPVTEDLAVGYYIGSRGHPPYGRPWTNSRAHGQFSDVYLIPVKVK